MDFQELISRFALALGIGLLIGLERGWRMREEKAGSRTAGIRTFAVTGLLGGVAGALGRTLGDTGGGVVIGLSIAAFGAVMAQFCLEQNRAEKQFSATTWVASMATFALGAYALIGDMRAAAALAVAMAVILAMREPMHDWVKAITWPELQSGLVLLAMTFIALPIMPDDRIGPFGGVNPREVWLIAIVLAGVSFAGYALVKYLGASLGILLAGAAGGLASSTAVTLTSARRAAAGEGSPSLLAGSVAAASAVMFVRVCAIVAAIGPALLPSVAPPLLAAAVVAAGHAAFAVYGRPAGAEAGGRIEFRNPFSFWSVVVFAMALGLVILLGRYLGEVFGATGAIVGAAAMGLADVDAVTVSMSRLAPDLLSPEEASLAILAAVFTNTAAKIGIGAVIGRGRFARDIAVMAVACLAAGILIAWFTTGLAPDALRR